MDFKLNFNIPEFKNQLEIGDNVTLLGSCFSDEMHLHFQNAGFNVLSNPFGTLFHPLTIANILDQAIDIKPNIRAFKRDDIYLSWNCGSTIFGSSEDELIKLYEDQLNSLNQSIQNKGFLILTFGTAYSHHLVDDDCIVANCHKVNANKFQKKLTSNELIIQKWKSLLLKLNEFNPELKIVLTVSPVRHSKEGLIENNRSKARLIEVVHSLTNNDSVEYFPSYEIVIDELRDYRFFKDDFVHPNDLAIKFIWEKINKSIIDSNCISMIERIEKYHRSKNHRSIHQSESNDLRLLKLEEERNSLEILFPKSFILK